MADLNTYSKEDRERAIALLTREKETKAKEKAKLADPAYKAKVTYASKFATMKNYLIVAKAKAANITVSDAEVTKALEAKGVKKL